MKTALLVLPIALAAQTWTPQTAGVTASLRGVSAVDSKIVWASGSQGTWLRTLDGGVTWQSGRVADAAALDFRGIRAFDATTAVLMSAGSGDKSRIYRTEDGGAHWSLLFTSPDPKGFFDGIAFWDRRRGILLGDAVDGRMTVFTTSDGGAHWLRRRTPPALANEGAFAASNSSLAVWGKNEAWFGTGGPGAARVYRSKDAGATWTVSATPVRNDSASAGIFSLAFRDSRHGIAVGGEYTKDQETRGNIAITRDGGRSWTAPQGAPHGYRSAVVYLPARGMWIAVGTSGSDFSSDGGATWTRFDEGSLNALAASPGGALWAVGGRGRIVALH